MDDAKASIHTLSLLHLVHAPVARPFIACCVFLERLLGGVSSRAGVVDIEYDGCGCFPRLRLGEKGRFMLPKPWCTCETLSKEGGQGNLPVELEAMFKGD